MDALLPFAFPHGRFPGLPRALAGGLPGLPGGGARLEVIRRWRDEGVVFVRLTTRTGPLPDLEVKWIGRVAGAPHLVVEAEPFDLDDEVLVQHVVKLGGAETAVALGEDDLVRLEPVLRAEIARRRVIPPADLAAALGAIADAGTPGYYAACLAERGVVRRLRLRAEEVAPGRAVSVREHRPSPEGGLVLVLEAPASGSREELLVRETCGDGGRRYVVLGAEEQTAIGGKGAQLALARVLTGQVVPLDEPEFDRAARALIDRLEGPRRGRRYRPLGAPPADDVDALVRALEWADEEAVPTLDGMSPGWKAPAVEVRALADDLVEIRVGDVTLELSRGEARLLVAELEKILP